MFKLYEKEVAEQKIIDVEKYVQSMSFWSIWTEIHRTRRYKNRYEILTVFFMSIISLCMCECTIA